MKKLLHLLLTLTFAHINGMNASDKEYALNQAHKRVHHAKIKADNARSRQREVSWEDDRVKENAQEKLINANEAYYDALHELDCLQHSHIHQKATLPSHKSNPILSSQPQPRSAAEIENDKITSQSVDNILSLISQARISQDLGRRVFHRSLGKNWGKEGMSTEIIAKSLNQHLTPEETILFMNGKADYPIVKKFLMAVDPEDTGRYAQEFSK